MKTRKMYSENDEGFVLVAALLILLVLTVMGIAVNRNTMTEWRIAMNDRQHKETFYSADAASELAAEILEQSVACLGFSDNGVILKGKKAGKKEEMHVYVEPGSGGFWRNYNDNNVPVPEDDTARDLVFPAVVVGGVYDAGRTNGEFPHPPHPHANIVMRGNTQLTPGSAIQMAAGYEGTAKGLGSGGASLVYDIKVYQKGVNNAVSAVCTKYLHALGSEGNCYY